MTRQKHLKIALTAIRKGIEQGFSPEQIAEGVVNRMEFALEQELEEAESGAKETNEVPSRELSSMPPPSSVIDVPESLPPEPFRVGIPGSSKKPTDTYKYWKQDELKRFVEQNAPVSLDIKAGGRMVHLDRNIEVQLGVDNVKLSYGIGANHPVPSSGPNFTGETLAPIPVDIVISSLFNCFDKDQSIDSKVEDIKLRAEYAYSPKPEHLHSSTPVRSGPISFSLENDPHEYTDKIPSPVDGQLH